MGKLPIGALAAVVLIIIVVGWAAGTYLPNALDRSSTGTSTTATTTGISSASGVSSAHATKALSPSPENWLLDNPAFVGNFSKIDYPPDYAILANFTLGVINKDRASAGLEPLVLTSMPAGQQHADSMAYYRYFSHWDNQGYKPYMRYTLLGGTGAVAENLALNYCSTSPDIARPVSAPCNIQTVENAINASEWAMMNSDMACCNNGHRENILGPLHNRVSLGVAYSAGAVYLVEDFEDNYIASGSLHLSAGIVTLNGSVPKAVQDAWGWMRTASGSEITVFYDPTPSEIHPSALALSTSCNQFNELNESAACQYQGAYNPGTQISTVFAPCPAQYVCAAGNYTYADIWQHSAGNFNIVFSISALESAHGSGVYTFYLWPAARAPEPITSLSIFVTGV